MEYGELCEYGVRNSFLKKSCRKWDLQTFKKIENIPDLFLFFKKKLYLR